MSWIWSTTTTSSAAVVIFFVYLLLRKLLISPSKNGKLPPGPIGLPIIGHLHLIGKKPHQSIHKLSKKYGPIMCLRFGFVPVIVVSSPKGAELILKTHDLTFAGRPYQLASSHISYDRRNIVFAPYGSYWRNMRKLCTLELLSTFKINQFQAMRSVEIGLFVDGLKASAKRGEVVDVSAGISSLSWDMICAMVFGKKYDGDRELGSGEKGFKAVINEAMQVAAKPIIADYFPFFERFDLQGVTKQLKELRRAFDDFLERIIADHALNREAKETPDFVDTMMSILESGEAGFEFDSRHVKAVLLDMLLAGVDTTSAAIEWTMSELIRHPNVMRKLKKELGQAIGTDRRAQESQIDGLEYLDNVVKESLRLHPVVPVLVHESLDDCTVEGYRIPKGSRIVVSAYSISKDPDVWREPDEFDPERFVGSDVDLRGHHFQLLPFGSGRRGCPGLQLGLTVVKLVVAQLVHCFDWELPYGDEMDMSEHFGLVVCREDHLMALPTYCLST